MKNLKMSKQKMILGDDLSVLSPTSPCNNGIIKPEFRGRGEFIYFSLSLLLTKYISLKN